MRYPDLDAMSKSFSFVKLLFVLLIASASLAQAALQLEPNYRVEVSGKVVRVKDIFPLVKGTLGEKKISYAPRPGRTLTLSCLTLKAKLHSAQLVCKQSVKVERKAKILTAEVIKEKVFAYLEQQGFSREQLFFTRKVSPLVLSTAPYELRFSLRASSCELFVTLDWLQEKLHRKVFFTLARRQSYQAWILKQSVKRGGELSDENAARKKIYACAQKEIYTGSGVGLLFQKNLSAGHILSPRELRAPLLLKARQRVKAYLQNKALELSFPALLLEGGNVGDVVQIKSLFNRQVMKAKILNQNEVEVVL